MARGAGELCSACSRIALLEAPPMGGAGNASPAAVPAPDVAAAATAPALESPPDRDRVVVIPRPSQLHAPEELPDVRPVVLASIGPAAARREADEARRRAAFRTTLRRIGLVFLVLIATLAIGGVLALLLSSIR